MMMEYMFYNKEGKGVTPKEGTALFSDENRRVADDYLPNGWRVSTILLVISHGTDDAGRPIIFESMAFGDTSEEPVDSRRYCTLEEAEQGHKEMVGECRKKAQRHIDEAVAEAKKPAQVSRPAIKKAVVDVKKPAQVPRTRISDAKLGGEHGC